ncbi:hypothetical protein AB0C10_27990 [Microbispora amethystogenes]|uniref:hypothetical protein n=1 Tax=Microbispora amethystogenes TaxID=1427754 RepID=UPI0033C1CD23
MGGTPTELRRIWDEARRPALSPGSTARRWRSGVYDLRHACLSTWLNAGVSPKQVAEWAGNSVEVLLRTYAKCLVGQDEVSMRRISETLG